MRFLKNSFAAVLIICTLASCSIAFAATPSSENSLGMSPQAQENFSKAPYKVQEEILSSPELSAAAPDAYMDLYSAPESLQHDILAARDLIIHSQSWTTDPNDYTVYPDGSIEHDPLFSDLFPGWDLPTLENSILETPSFSISQPLALTKAIAPSVAKIPNYYIPKYNASRPTPVMIKLRSTTVETFAVIVDSLPGATCNIGIANANGVELKNKLRVPVHGECHIFPDKGQYYSARVSTYDKPGSGSFRVLY